MTTTDRVLETIRQTWERIDREGLELTPDSDLRSDLGFDSLDVMEVVMECEIACNAPCVPDEAFNRIRTVADLVAALDERRAMRKAVGR